MNNVAFVVIKMGRRSGGCPAAARRLPDESHVIYGTGHYFVLMLLTIFLTFVFP